MRPILAEDLSGWLLAGTALFGGLGASLLALGALIPAVKGRTHLTFLLAAPAFLIGLAVTVCFTYGFFANGLHDREYNFGQDFVIPWIFMAGPALGTSLLAVIVLWFKTKQIHES